MITEDDPKPETSRVETLSIHGFTSIPNKSVNNEDRVTAEEESSSGGSSVLDLKQKLQDLPSPNKASHLASYASTYSGRSSHNHDFYLHLQSTANCIEEKEEPSENDHREKTSLVGRAPSQVVIKDARARRRARINAELSEVMNKMILPHLSRNSSPIPKNSPGSSITSSMSNDENVSEQKQSDLHSPTPLENFSDEKSKVMLGHASISNYRRQSFQSLQSLGNEESEIKPLPPIPLCKTPPVRFGGYRPVQSTLLKNFNSGSDTESPNNSSRITSPCKSSRISNSSSICNIGSVHSTRISHIALNSPGSIETRTRLPLSPVGLYSRSSSDDQRVLSLKQRNIEESIKILNSSETSLENRRLLSLSSPKELSNDNHHYQRLPNLPPLKRVGTKTPIELPALSARSNICEYRKEVSPVTSGSTLHQLSKSLTLDTNIFHRKNNCTINSNEIIGECKTKLTTADDFKKTEKSSKNATDGIQTAAISQITYRKQSFQSLLQKEYESTSMTEIPINSLNSSEILQLENPLKESNPSNLNTIFTTNSTESDGINVPSLVLDSQEMSCSTSLTNRSNKENYVLDTNALTTALSRASFTVESDSTRNAVNDEVDSKTTMQSNSSQNNVRIIDRSSMNQAHNEAIRPSPKTVRIRSRIPIMSASSKNSSRFIVAKSANELSERILESITDANNAETMSIDLNKQILPNALPCSGEFQLNSESKYPRPGSHNTQRNSAGKNDSHENFVESISPISGLSSCLNHREQSKHSTARYTPNTSVNCSESGSSLERPCFSLQNVRLPQLQQEVTSDESRCQLSKRETPNPSFRTRSDRTDETNDSYEPVESIGESTQETHLPENRYLKLNEDECLRLNLNTVQEMSSIEELSEETTLTECDNNSERTNNCKSTQAPSWCSGQSNRSKYFEDNEKNSCDDNSEQDSNCEDPDVDIQQLESYEEISEDNYNVMNSAIGMKTKPQFYEETLDWNASAKTIQDNTEIRRCDKLQFSVEQLAAEKFRKSMSLECARPTPLENSTFTYENHVFPVCSSASTSKLFYRCNNVKQAGRPKKQSQDRFPFTISENSSAVFAKMTPKADGEFNINAEDTMRSIERVSKLHVHPSITRLAGAGFEGNPFETVNCVAYNQQVEQRPGPLGMKGFIQKFSAKFKRSRDPLDRVKVEALQTNIIYQNPGYHGDSDPNSCSESSLLKTLSKHHRISSNGHTDLMEKKRSIDFNRKLSRHKGSRNLLLRENGWVDGADKSIECNEQEDKASGSGFSVNQIQNVSELAKACSSIQTDKNNPIEKGQGSLRAAHDPLSLDTSNLEQRQCKYNDENKPYDECEDTDGTESDCFCLRFCQIIPRLFIHVLCHVNTEYPTSIKTGEQVINQESSRCKVRAKSHFCWRTRKGR